MVGKTVLPVQTGAWVQSLGTEIPHAAWWGKQTNKQTERTAGTQSAALAL